MVLQLIAKGRLDWAEGTYLIWPKDAAYPRGLGEYIHRHIGKTIVISLEEEEPMVNNNFKELLAEA